MAALNTYEKICAERRKLIKRTDIVLVSTENEKVLGEEFIDGHIEITTEWRRINETQCEYIQHRNIDANGNFYTKRDIVKRTKPLTIERVTL